MNNSKKILRIILYLLVLLIPTYLAIYSIYTMNTDEIIIESVTQITVLSANGTEIIYNRAADFRPFIRAVNEARNLARAPYDLTAERPALLTFFKMGDRVVEYELFLNLNPDLGVLRDAEGELFHIRPEDARQLLNKQISHELFAFNRLPIAGVPHGDANVPIYPAGGIWRLRKPDAGFQDTSISSITAEYNYIRISQDNPFAISFEVEPDIVEIEVFRYRERIFNGLLSQFLDSDILNFETRTELHFVLTAEWRENDYNYYYGEAVFNINVVYEVPAIFSISDHQAEPGDIIVITASNVGAGDVLRLSAPEIGHEKEFWRQGEYRIALVPVGLGFSGELNINITGDYSADYQVTVRPGEARSANVGSADENIPGHLSDNARHQRHVKYEEILGMPSGGQRLWTDNFISPVGMNVLFAFGTSITVNMGNAFINNGVNLAAGAGEPVLASNAGTVIFTGRLPLDGNLLVIDHGAGVRTWYARLGDISVQEGDAVEQGQQIATAGGSGMPASPALGLSFAVSIGDIFIDPVRLLGLDIGLGAAEPAADGEFFPEAAPE